MSEQTHSERWTVDDATGCWNWTGYVDERGYARDGAQAHRLVYERLVGPIGEGLELHHRCRNTRCVNPEHMQPILPREHRLLHWQDRGLTDEQVSEIVRLLAGGELTMAEIGGRLGLPRTTVNNIAQGRHSAVDAAPIPKRECAFCGSRIEGRRRSARYCSIPCRRMFNTRKAMAA